jgi:hypothetical protein
MIDGEFTMRTSGSGSEGILGSRTPTIVLMPGRHTLMVMYGQQSISSTSSGTVRTMRTSDLVPVTGDFLAGRYYKLLPQVDGDTVSFHIVEENNPDIWNSRDITSIKAPRKVSFTTLINRATIMGGTTQFEGTWTVKDMAGASFVFTKERFMTVQTVELTENQISVYNSNRKTTGQSPLSSPTFNAQRGTFAVKGNQIIITAMQGTADNNLDVALWGDYSRKIDTTFDFAFNSEGNLVLTFKKGRHILNPLTQVNQLVLIKK